MHHEQVLQQRGRQLRSEIRAALLRADADRHALLAEQVHDTRDQSVLDSLAGIDSADIARDARLTAYPTAKRCQPCQQRDEHRHPG